MNKIDIYLSALLSNVIGFFFNFLMFFIFYNFIDSKAEGISINNFWIIPLFINLFILSLAISMIISTIFIIAKDINQIWQVFTSFLFFLSPIIYKASTFEISLPLFNYFNPIAGIIINARSVLMNAQNPDFSLMLFDFGYALTLLLIGLLLLNRLGSKASEKL